MTRLERLAGCTLTLLLCTALAGCSADAPATSAPEGATEVGMLNSIFTPKTIRIAVGDTVSWVNNEKIEHTVTPTDEAAWGTQGSGDAPSTWLGLNERWNHTFTKAGTYEYYCIPHAFEQDDGSWIGMVGTVIVE